MSASDCLYVKCIGSARVCLCVCQGQGGGPSLQTSDAWDPINSCIQRQIWLQMEVEIKGADESKGFQAGWGRGGRGHVEALKAWRTPNWELWTQWHLWSNHVFDAIKQRVPSASAQERNPVARLTDLIHWLIWFTGCATVLSLMKHKKLFFFCYYRFILVQHAKS